MHKLSKKCAIITYYALVVEEYGGIVYEAYAVGVCTRRCMHMDVQWGDVGPGS